MKEGDVYNKHVRGSRYVFSHGTVYYKYPNNIKGVASDNYKEIASKCRKVGKRPSGRFIVNEEGEVVTYNKISETTWRPYYVGKLDSEIKFDYIDNNPKGLEPGSFWTGFISSHGGRYRFNDKGKIYFQETIFKKHMKTRNQYSTLEKHVDLIERLTLLCKLFGSFHINEHRQIWIPVEKAAIKKFFNIS